MRRPVVYAGFGLAALLALLVASQLIVPAYLEHRAESRLTEHGGKAHVDIDALPAARLLWHDGRRIEVRGERLDVPLEGERGRVFDELDRFKEADVRLDRLTAGPLRIARFSLTKSERDGPYALTVASTVTPRALSDYAGRQIGGPLVGLLGRLAAALLPFDTSPIPIQLDAVIVSRHGRPEVQRVDGTVAGFPADPLVAALASAIAARL